MASATDERISTLSASDSTTLEVLRTRVVVNGVISCCIITGDECCCCCCCFPARIVMISCSVVVVAAMYVSNDNTKRRWSSRFVMCEMMMTVVANATRHVIVGALFAFVTTVRAFHVVLVSEKLTEGEALSGANCLASDATTFGVVLSPPFSTRLLR